eukprot:TRINITY_DN8097_c0_g1_i1.p1 TRINITY_DN8097_c0_g1~~TRINITY_DN8097_c0_g1_i1.p1  ORF type:complete len:463 (-),score=97.37 TRINITY_DN8097_c0_g1_i1:3-1391(-)
MEDYSHLYDMLKQFKPEEISSMDEDYSGEYGDIIEQILNDDYSSSSHSEEEYTVLFDDLVSTGGKVKKKSRLEQNTSVLTYDKDANKFTKSGLPLIGEGIIYVKQKLGFAKRWAQVDSSTMYLFKSQRSYLEGASPKGIINVLFSTVQDFDNLFDLLTCDGRRISFKGDTVGDTLSWSFLIQDILNKNMTSKLLGDERENSSSESGEGKQSLYSLLDLDENQNCSDCLAEDPDWASLTFGVFLCLDCSGIHRSLGSHISFVRSVALDKWEEEQIEVMARENNSEANSFWEKELNVKKPAAFDSLESKKEYIIAKYLKKQFTGEVSNEELSNHILIEDVNLDKFTYEFFTQRNEVKQASQGTVVNKRASSPRGHRLSSPRRKRLSSTLASHSKQSISSTPIQISSKNQKQRNSVGVKRKSSKPKTRIDPYITDHDLFKDALLLLFQNDQHFCRQVKQILSMEE